MDNFQESFLQKLLWRIAGAEISILREHKVDHKKFSAIGFAIAVTTFIAFLSGTAAAWFFTKTGDDTSGNILWALSFGIVWCILIFCIDRCLVITLRKRPNQHFYWWIVPFFTRALLAGVIAFMVSIPLELVVFDTFIQEQSFAWNEDRKNTLSKDSYANHEAMEIQQSIDWRATRLSKLDREKNNLEEARDDRQSEIDKLTIELNNPTTQSYNKALSEKASFKQRLINEYARQKDSIYYRRNKSQVDHSIQTLIWNVQQCDKTINYEIARWNEPRNARILRLKVEKDSIKSLITSNDSVTQIVQTQVDDLSTQKDSLDKQRNSTVENYNNAIKKGNHFIKNFEILEYGVSPKSINCTYCNQDGYQEDGSRCIHCNGTKLMKSEDRPLEWYFLWLIRLLFLIIELLPTVVKLAMPMGEYDLDLFYREEEAKKYFLSQEFEDKMKALHELQQQSKELQLQSQIKAEEEMRHELMEKLRTAQMEIADQAIKKWKERELNKM